MTDLRFALLVVLLPLAGCVQFQPQQLYSGVEAAPDVERPRTLRLAVEPTIYDDATDDTVWFQDDARCTQAELTTETVYAGQRAVEVSWDRGADGCEWAGLGFGWDGWAGKDLSQVLPYAAVEMYVRSGEGRMFGLPVVLTLEDYSGGLGFAYTANQYFERPTIDEEWQRVVVPLSAFDIAAPGAPALDVTNVKQLMLELQGSGKIYLDAVKLVWYEPEPQEPWIELPERPDPTALPITLFGDAFVNDDGWGLVSDGCQSVELTTDRPATGTTALRAAWDVTADGCYQGSLGVSWDQWYPRRRDAGRRRDGDPGPGPPAPGGGSGGACADRDAGLRRPRLGSADLGSLRARCHIDHRVADADDPARGARRRRRPVVGQATHRAPGQGGRGGPRRPPPRPHRLLTLCSDSC